MRASQTAASWDSVPSVFHQRTERLLGLVILFQPYLRDAELQLCLDATRRLWISRKKLSEFLDRLGIEGLSKIHFSPGKPLARLNHPRLATKIRGQ